MGRGQRETDGTSTAKGLLYGVRPRRPRHPDPVEVERKTPERHHWKDEDGKMFAFLQSSGYIAPGNYTFAQGMAGSIDGPGTAAFEIAAANSADDETVPVTTLGLRDSDGRLGAIVRHRDQRDRGYVHFAPIDRGPRPVESADQLTDDLLSHGQEIGLDYVERHLTYEEVEPRLDRGERLEIVWDEDDQANNSSDKILAGAIQQANRYRASQGDVAVDALVEDLQSADPNDRSSYVDVMSHHRVGRKIMTGWGGTWVYRILVNRGQDKA